MCCPRSGYRPSLWGTLSQFPFYAAEKFGQAFDDVDAALDSFADRHSSTIEAIEGAVDAVADRLEKLPGAAVVADLLFEDEEEQTQARTSDVPKEPEATPEQKELAREAVDAFCAGYSDTSQVVPSDRDLTAFWSRCNLLYACVFNAEPLAEAFAGQLDGVSVGKATGSSTGSSNVAGAKKAQVAAASWDEALEPRFLRTLLALEYFHAHCGSVGAAITVAVAQRAGRQLRALGTARGLTEDGAEEPVAQTLLEVATRLAKVLLGEATALDGEWTPKKTPGRAIHSISRGTIRWFDGTMSELTPEGLNKVSVPLLGRVRRAELSENGQELVWAHGDIWVRASVALSVEDKGCSGSDCVCFLVQLDRAPEGPAAKLGLDIQKAAGYLRIQRVREGLVRAWNLEHLDKEVRCGDHIVAVNGVTENCDRIVDVITMAMRLQILVRRPAQSGSSSSTQPASGTATKARIAPPILHVRSPNGQQASAGEYHVVDGEKPNGQPLWRKVGGGADRWLYSSTSGAWTISDQDEKDKNFKSTAGFIASLAPHGGAMPHEVRWKIWDGTQKKWTLDVDIIASAPALKGPLDGPMRNIPSSSLPLDMPRGEVEETMPPAEADLLSLDERPKAAPSPAKDCAPFVVEADLLNLEELPNGATTGSTAAQKSLPIAAGMARNGGCDAEWRGWTA
jgi:hypothetical protein